MNAMRRPSGADARARIVTKGGMTRVGGGWVPDGRAKALRADCEASLAALDGLPIDLYLIHAPDPRTPWRTSLRALERLVVDGLVRHVGVSNVNRPLLDEAVALAWLLALSPQIVAIAGARRPETARSAAAAAAITLDPEERMRLDREFGAASAARKRRSGAEVVLVMGIPGAGKSRVAEEYVVRGYERLNRDERGGSLRELAAELDERLAAGAPRGVLGKTDPT